MCGIVGIADLTGRRPDYDAIGRATRDMLTHRCPDEAGERRDGPVWLGSRRLSIIDVGGGRLPMGHEDGTVWTVYNGEIYNFPAVRAELEAPGHRSGRAATPRSSRRRSRSGAAHASSGSTGYSRSPCTMPRTAGSSSPAIAWVRNRSTTSGTAGSFSFASEIKALVHHPDVSRRIDPLAVSKT